MTAASSQRKAERAYLRMVGRKADLVAETAWQGIPPGETRIQLAQGYYVQRYALTLGEAVTVSDGGASPRLFHPNGTLITWHNGLFGLWGDRSDQTLTATRDFEPIADALQQEAQAMADRNGASVASAKQRARDFGNGSAL